MPRSSRLLLLTVLLLALVAPAGPAAAATPARAAGPVPMAAPGSAWNKDELLHVDRAGDYRVYNVDSRFQLAGTLRSDELSGSWHQITAVDLDGDQQDELFLYNRTTRAYRFYDVDAAGQLTSRIRSGTLSQSWTIARGVDLDGDHRDELLLYNSSSSRYQFYDLSSSGSFTSLSGGTFGRTWKELTPVDLDGDHRDELLLYASSGAYSYYNIGSAGAIGSRLRSGTWSSWTSIVAVDALPDRADELLFYNSSSRRYSRYDVGSTGSLGSSHGTGRYQGAWLRIVSINVDQRTHGFVSEILDLVNEERRDAGLSAVSSNMQARTEAQRWSAVMADAGRIWHRTDLFHGLPSSARTVGENVAAGYGSPEEVMAAWMASSGHRQNILNPSFTRLGIGVAPDSNGTLYYTQIFFGT